MSLLDILAALFSAVLHAGWNAVVKARPSPAEAMTSQMLIGSVAALPAFWLTGLPALAAWPWMIATVLANLVTLWALFHAYEHGAFGVVYPVMRALSVMIVVPVSTLMVGDRLTVGALFGIALIVGALTILGLGARRGGDFGPKALAWTAVAGAFTAVYVLCDGTGVRLSGTPLGYAFSVSILNFVCTWRVLAPTVGLRQLAFGDWRRSVPVAVAATVSYALFLWVIAHAPIAPSAALRDTSAVFAVLISIVALREPFTRSRLV
jgi:drug/metabolite transporter (DMT)-like permease